MIKEQMMISKARGKLPKQRLFSLLILLFCVLALVTYKTVDFFNRGANPGYESHTQTAKVETEKVSLDSISKPEEPVVKLIDPPLRGADCVLITFTLKLTGIEVVGFSDPPAKNCTQEQYEKLSIPSVAAQLRTTQYKPYRVVLAGRQIGTADISTRGFTAPFIQVADINFYPVSRTYISYIELILGIALSSNSRVSTPGEAFFPYLVHEDTYYRWNAGRRIYTITTDQDEIYVLTSYSNKLSTMLGAQSLSDLGSTMKLPKGWKYEVLTLTKVLERRLTEKSPEKTYRLMDSYQNIYLGFKRSDFY